MDMSVIVLLIKCVLDGRIRGLNMKKIIRFLLALALAITSVVFAGCSSTVSYSVMPSQSNTASAGSSTTAAVSSVPVTVTYDVDDLTSSWNSSLVSYIKLNGDSVSMDGDGVTVSGNRILITSAGTYTISGTLDDGQIVVDTQEEETVRLVLNGVDITCSTSAPIYALNAEKVVITLVAGTKNYITNGTSYILEDATSDEPNAAIFSNDDLTINGDGSLVVDANYNNGIQSKDDLYITGGNITVTAVNDGIKGRDSIAVKDGNITIDAGGDGMQSNNDEDAAKGFIAIEGGAINIVAGADGIQAETSILISGGDITISSGGGSANASTGSSWGFWGSSNTTDTSDSAKGIKAGVDLNIDGGTIEIDSSDDALHSNGSMTISEGDIAISSGDDGMHADTSIVIDGGNIIVTKCYEGIESAVITINGGDINLTASDDGINVSGGADGSSINGRPGQNSFSYSGSSCLYINGGYIVVYAGGDGLDSNGSISMTDGIVIVNGPTDSANGALDFMTCNVSGGYLLAVGSSGMAQAPGTSSTQYSVMVTFSSALQAGTLVHIESGDGDDVLTFMLAKTCQSVVLCSSELHNGETYVVYTGGNSTGSLKDGLYSGGTYSNGTQYTSFTVSSIVTSVGGGAAFPGGNVPGGGGRR